MKSLTIFEAAILWCSILHFAIAQDSSPQLAEILRDIRTQADSHGGYSFSFQTSNGIYQSEMRDEQVGGGKMMTKGEYMFSHPDGTVHKLSYMADENGFTAESDMIPTPFPLEPWQEEQVRFAEEERRLAEKEKRIKALQDLLKKNHFST